MKTLKQHIKDKEYDDFEEDLIPRSHLIMVGRNEAL